MSTCFLYILKPWRGFLYYTKKGSITYSLHIHIKAVSTFSLLISIVDLIQYWFKIYDLLPFYAILRSIPNKLLGVIAMFSAILAIMLLPVTDLGRSKGLQFRPLSKIVFYIFVANFLVLMSLGAKHVESPFI